MTDAAPTSFLVITGQTASGKERVALRVAEQLAGEIISLDSMKVYRGMDIGTASPSAEARRHVRHHLVDVADPADRFSAAQWTERAGAALADISARGRVPIVSGGTILYLKALLYGLFEGPPADPAIRRRIRDEAARAGVPALHARLAEVDPRAADRIHPNDLRRIERALEVHEITGRAISEMQQQFGRLRPGLDPLLVGLRRTREDLRSRIDTRVDRMMAAGFEDEVRRLLARPGGLSREAAQAVGYREMIDLLQGRTSRDEAVELVKKNTRTFARRQMTHLRSVEGLTWLDLAPDELPGRTAERVVELWRRHRSGSMADG